MFTRAGILVALLAPTLAFAAFDDVSLSTDAVVSANGVTFNVTGSTATIQSITVNSTDFSVTVLSGSTFQVTASGRERITTSDSTGKTNYLCNSSQSFIKYEPTSTVTFTITASTADICSGGGGGSSSDSSVSSTSSSSSSSSTSSTTTVTPATPVTPAVTPAVPATPATPAVSATPASGLSVSQIQSILDVLTSFEVDAATMASVRAALEGTNTGSVTSTAVQVFKANLTVGSLGSEVKALQEFLNAHGYTVAPTGAGSPGNETSKFGPATKAALIKYQKAKGITPAAGYFGAKTRAAINAE